MSLIRKVNVAKFVPRAITENGDFLFANKIAFKIMNQVPKLAGWAIPAAILGEFRICIS